MIRITEEANKILKNTTWLIGCRIIQALLSFVIGILSARYLGPSNYGVIDYAGAITSFMVPVVQLGIRSTLVHEIISDPTNEGRTVGTSLLMSVMASSLGIVGVAAFVSIANKGESETIIVCVLYSVSLVFQASEMMQYWFQAKLLSKYVAVISLVSYIGVSAYRCFLLIAQKSVYWFALSQALDCFFISVGLFIAYRKQGGKKLSFSLDKAKSIFRRSKYYIVSGIMVTLFSLTDRVMITLMLGKEANGYYSAAVTCADMSRFVFAAIIDSVRPSILEAKKVGSKNYYKNISRLYSITIYLALIQCIAFMIGASVVVKIIYGDAYIEAISTLRIITWYTAFAHMGTVRNIWSLAEQKQHVLWKINLSGALLNIVVNSLLIPIIGINGAAISSVLSQFFVNFVLCIIIKPLKTAGKLMIDGINPFNLRKLWS